MLAAVELRAQAAEAEAREVHCCCNLGGGSSFKPRKLEIGSASLSKKGPMSPKGPFHPFAILAVRATDPPASRAVQDEPVLRRRRAPVRSRLQPAQTDARATNSDPVVARMVVPLCALKDVAD